MKSVVSLEYFVNDCSYLSVLKLKNYSSQCSRKIKENLFLIIEATNGASTINSIMNLSHALCVIDDAKVLCSILYSSPNIKIKSCWSPEELTSVALI